MSKIWNAIVTAWRKSPVVFVGVVLAGLKALDAFGLHITVEQQDAVKDFLTNLGLLVAGGAAVYAGVFSRETHEAKVEEALHEGAPEIDPGLNALNQDQVHEIEPLEEA